MVDQQMITLTGHVKLTHEFLDGLAVQRPDAAAFLKERKVTVALLTVGDHRMMLRFPISHAELRGHAAAADFDCSVSTDDLVMVLDGGARHMLAAAGIVPKPQQDADNQFSLENILKAAKP